MGSLIIRPGDGSATADPWRDREPEVHARFADGLAERLRSLVDATMVEEHRRSPIGPHTPALALVLAYVRQAPVAGKLVLHALEPSHRWTVLRLSGIPGVAHQRIDDLEYHDRAEAEHAVFLARLAALDVLPTALPR